MTVTALKSRNLVVKKSLSEEISDQAQCPAQPLISTQHELSNFSEFFFIDNLFKADQMVDKLTSQDSRNLSQTILDSEEKLSFGEVMIHDKTYTGDISRKL